MLAPHIVIIIHGGLVQEVYCSGQLADLVVVDWDVRGGDEGITEVQRAGETLRAYVTHPIVTPLNRLADTAVEAVIRITGCRSLTPTDFRNADRSYTLALDGPTFRAQRQRLLEMVDALHQGKLQQFAPADKDLLEGLVNLTDAIADQAADRYRIDCLLPAWEETEASNAEDESHAEDRLSLPCDCEAPGVYCSGVPGILAHVEDGKLSPGCEVQRCDHCERYASDEAARAKLVELGVAPESAKQGRYVLYDIDTDALVSTTTYDSPQEAADDADQFDDVIVLPLPIAARHEQEENLE